jgi:hypothetical protein
VTVSGSGWDLLKDLDLEGGEQCVKDLHDPSLSEPGSREQGTFLVPDILCLVIGQGIVDHCKDVAQQVLVVRVTTPHNVSPSMPLVVFINQIILEMKVSRLITVPGANPCVEWSTDCVDTCTKRGGSRLIQERNNWLAMGWRGSRLRLDWHDGSEMRVTMGTGGCRAGRFLCRDC